MNTRFHRPSKCICASIVDRPVQSEGCESRNSGLELGLSMTWSESLHLLASVTYLWREEVGLDSSKGPSVSDNVPRPTWIL